MSFRKIFLILFLLAALGAAVTPMAHAQAGPAAPEITARSAYMINADSGEVIYSKSPDQSMAMASTTKMMTALLVMEKDRKSTRLNSSHIPLSRMPSFA